MFTRRQFVAGTVLTQAAALLGHKPAFASTAAFDRPLPIPPLLDARDNGNKIKLVAAKGQHAFVAGKETATAGYSGQVLGPAIRVRSGDEIDVTVENKLDRSTTVHWHGLLIPGESDGGTHNHFAPGQSWQTKLKINQPEATGWFHPHPHGETGRQVYSGLAGLLLIDDGGSERLGLPRNYGVDDIPIILQDRQLSANGSLQYAGGSFNVMLGARGDTVIANGIWAPVARVPANLVRLRLLNGSNARNFNLAFSDRRVFHVIASDGGYLPAPVAMSRLIISPGERFEILVDFSSTRPVILETGADAFVPMMGMMDDDVSGAAQIMKFEADATKQSSAKLLPRELAVAPRTKDSAGLRRRRFLLNDHMMGMGRMQFRNGGMAINGRPFDPERIDLTVPLGASEIWEIESQMMAHPFHIHGVHFTILSLDGRVPAAHLRGLKDTVLIRRSAQILVQFTQPATQQHPFMYHCHILEHEDAGMMGQYITT